MVDQWFMKLLVIIWYTKYIFFFVSNVKFHFNKKIIIVHIWNTTQTKNWNIFFQNKSLLNLTQARLAFAFRVFVFFFFCKRKKTPKSKYLFFSFFLFSHAWNIFCTNFLYFHYTIIFNLLGLYQTTNWGKDLGFHISLDSTWQQKENIFSNELYACLCLSNIHQH